MYNLWLKRHLDFLHLVYTLRCSHIWLWFLPVTALLDFFHLGLMTFDTSELAYDLCVHNSEPTILTQHQLCFIVTGWKGWLRLAQEDHIILLYFSASSCFCPWKSHLIIGHCFCYRLWCFHLACKEILFVFGKFIFFSLFMWRLWQGQKLPEQMVLVNYAQYDQTYELTS